MERNDKAGSCTYHIAKDEVCLRSDSQISLQSRHFDHSHRHHCYVPKRHL